MSDWKFRLIERLEPILEQQDPRPDISAYHDMPYAIFRYLPEHEFELRRELDLLSTRLHSAGKRVTRISLVACMLEALEAEGFVGETLESAEADVGVASTIETIHKILSEYQPLDEMVAARFPADADPLRDIVFIERAGGLYPMSRRGESRNLLFVVDEVGQFVARDVQKMLDLQAVVQNLGRVGRGRMWIVVTSQEKLSELVGGLDDKRVELARLMDRFPLQVHLEPSDISEVTSQRILSKTSEAEQRRNQLFALHRGRLTDNTRLTADIKLPELTTESFTRLYPLLPYQIELIIRVVSGIRTQGGASKHVGGADRLEDALSHITGFRRQRSCQALKAFIGCHLELKEAIQRRSELGKKLYPQVLEALERSKNALEQLWPVLEQERDLEESLKERHGKLTDLMKKETFFNHLPEIDEHPAALENGFSRRYQASAEARRDAYLAALQSLRATEGWGQLTNGQQTEVSAPLERRLGVPDQDQVSLGTAPGRCRRLYRTSEPGHRDHVAPGGRQPDRDH